MIQPIRKEPRIRQVMRRVNAGCATPEDVRYLVSKLDAEMRHSDRSLTRAVNPQGFAHVPVRAARDEAIGQNGTAGENERQKG